MLQEPDAWSLPDEDYRFSLGIRPGIPRTFFGPSPDRDRLLAERRHWLITDSARYAAILPSADACLAEVETLATEWGFVAGEAGSSASERLLELGQQIEPDLVFLVPDASGLLAVVAGCVCFPSFWRLTDKMGLPLESVHGPVPQLNAFLGSSIHRYLTQMKPGGCWVRTNWGLASRPDLNEHPDRGRHPWKQPLSLDQVWLRREDQAILSLPNSGGVLFGIRLIIRSVAELAQSPETASRLARALRTMPAEMVRYKGLDDIRSELIALLDTRI